MRKAEFCRRLVTVTSGGWLICAGAPPVSALSVTVENFSHAALECQVLGAHWYARPAQALPPDGTLTLGFAVQGGVARMENGLPVERVFCGLAGQAWPTRAEIDLTPLLTRGSATVGCRVDQRVACE